MNAVSSNLPHPSAAARRLRSRGGYTLIEIMLVLTIIAVLLGAAITKIVGNLDAAKEVRVHADIETITTQLKTYEMENLFMPTTEQGLQALTTEPTSDPKPRHWRLLLPEPMLDPWGMPYNYRNPGTKNPNGFDLYSFGPSRQENEKDIGNWEDKPASSQ